MISGWTFRFLLIALVVAGIAQAPAAVAQKVALVIGNSAYQHAPVLRNPANDAADVAGELTAIGFEVQVLTDLTQGALLDALRGFQRTATGAEIALVYYAGHGLEIDRTNYLIPIDAVLENDTDVNFEAVPLQTMILAASGARRLSFLIIDACRDNPFAASMKRSLANRSIGRGLAAIEPTQRDTLVAYAAKEGSTAADGSGRNSPYAKALMTALSEPGLEVGLMMRRVRDAVLEATNGQQEPFVYGSLSAEAIYLNNDRGLVPVTPAEPVAAQPDTSAPAELLFWRLIKDSVDPEEFESYLLIYPDGVFAAQARQRLKDMERTASLTPNDAPATSDAPARTQGVEPPGPARPLERSELVELQERLSAGGHDTGPADGIFGARTAAAIRDFEAARDRVVLGEATLPVLQALRESVSDTTLANWRKAQQAEAAARRAAAAEAARNRPVATPRKPRAPAVPQASVPPQQESTAKNDQFCVGQRSACESSVCRGPRRAFDRSCNFCPIYDQRCK